MKRSCELIHFQYFIAHMNKNMMQTQSDIMRQQNNGQETFSAL